jgi:hypothetical protein
VKRCLVAVLLVAGGCDRAFGLVRDPDPPICGPYGVPEAVPFSPGLLAAGVHDFSVDATGQIGMATANLPATPLPMWRGPHAIKLDDTGVWIQDLARDKLPLNNLQGGHIEYDGRAVGWTDVPNATLREYTFSTTAMAWAQSMDPIENTLTVSAHVGNTIATPDGILRNLVEILIPDRLPFENTLQIYEKFGGMPWELTAQGNPLRTAKPALNITGAALTMAHDRIVYTANVGGEDDNGTPVYRIFAGMRIRDQYEPGVELVIDGIESPVGISEPWIDADCTTLYFRQNEVTWKATQVSE